MWGEGRRRAEERPSHRLQEPCGQHKAEALCLLLSLLLPQLSHSCKYGFPAASTEHIRFTLGPV